MKLHLAVFGLIIVSIIFCSSTSKTNHGLFSEPPLQNDARKFTYLALGDSYTIGESVEEKERWPNQLTTQLNSKGTRISATTIVAKTGWRTDNMLTAAKEQIKNEKFDLVSLLIGVNNEYQGWEPKKFEPEFKKCLQYAIDHCTAGKKGVFVMSIPDYGYTPFGANKQQKISARLDQYNAICERISEQMSVPFYNITDISRKGIEDPSLVAADGLHPSGKQYGLWVNKITDNVKYLLNPDGK